MIPLETRVYFARQPADFRKSFDGLSILAQKTLDKDPSKGGLFVFMNKKRSQVRILFRDKHGWCLLSKRLDNHLFRSVVGEDGCLCWEIQAKELLQFLSEVISCPLPNKNAQKKTHLRLVSPST